MNHARRSWVAVSYYVFTSIWWLHHVGKPQLQDLTYLPSRSTWCTIGAFLPPEVTQLKSDLMTLKTIPLGHILIRNENKQVTILTTMLVGRIKSNFFYYRNLHCVDNVRGTVIRDGAKVLGESPLSNSVHLTNKNLLKTPKNQPEFSTCRSGAGIAARLHVSVITIISDQSWSQCHPSVAYKSLNTLHQSIKQFISQLTMYCIEIFTNSQLSVKPLPDGFFYVLLYNLWNGKVLYWCSKHSSSATFRVPFLRNTRERDV